jgi:hypothetical protein
MFWKVFRRIVFITIFLFYCNHMANELEKGNYGPLYVVVIVLFLLVVYRIWKLIRWIHSKISRPKISKTKMKRESKGVARY